MFVFLVLFMFVYLLIKCIHSLNLLPDSQRTLLKNDDSTKGNIRECFFVVVFVLGVMLEPELPVRPQPVCRLPYLSGFDRLPSLSWVNRFLCLN